MSYLNNITPEQRIKLREKARISREQKKEQCKDVRTEYMDMGHWEALASKYGVRLPFRYLPASDIKYVTRVAKKLGVDVKAYVETTGCRSMKEFASLNSNWSAASMVGLFLEWVDEIKGVNN